MGCTDGALRRRIASKAQVRALDTELAVLCIKAESSLAHLVEIDSSGFESAEMWLPYGFSMVIGTTNTPSGR